MASEFVIRIKVDSSGAVDAAEKTERALGRTRNSAMELNKILHHVFGIYAIKEAVGGIIELSDAYTSLKNKLSVVSSDQSNLNRIMNETFKIAQDTRNSWETTATMFARMTRSTNQLGLSQQEVLNFTKLLNESVVVGGASAQEASAGLYQLSQGMAKGKLDGDELRAVLEELPYVADVIAKHMGVTRGELRALGRDGKISAKTIYDAFKEAAPQIEELFAKTAPTLSQGWEMVRNSAVKFFGELGTKTGVLGGLAAALAFVSQHFEIFGKALVTVGQIMAVFLAQYAITKLIQALVLLAQAANANPFTSLLYIVVSLIAFFRQFGDDLNTHIKVWTNVNDKYVTFGDILRVVWKDIKALGAAIYEFVSGAWKSISEAFQGGLDTGGFASSLRTALLFVASFVDAAYGLFRFLGKSIIDVFLGLPAALAEIFEDIGRGIALVFEAIINLIIAGLNKLIQLSNKLSDAFLGGVDYDKLQKALAAGDKKAAAAAMHTDGPHMDEVGKVDLDFKNPYAGSGRQIGQSIKDNFDEMMNTDFAKKFVDEALNNVGKYMDSVATRAHQEAVNRLMGDGKGEGDLNGGGASSVKNLPDKKALAEYKKLWNELQAVMKKSSPMTAAWLELARAVDVTTRAVAAGMIGVKEADKIVNETAERTADAREPYRAMIRDMHNETVELSMDAGEREIANRLREAEIKLREKQEYITQQQIQGLKDEIQNRMFTEKLKEIDLKHQQDLQAAMERIKGPQEEYNRALKIANELRADGAITQRQYNEEVKKAGEDAYAAYVARAAKNDPLTAGVNASIDKIRDEMMNVGKAIDDFFQQAFKNMEKFIIDTVETGKINLDTLKESMLHLLNEIALKLIEMKAIQFLGSINTGGGGGGGLTSTLTSIGVGMATGNPAAGAAAGGITAVKAGKGSPTNLNVHITDSRDRALAPAVGPDDAKVVMTAARRSPQMYRLLRKT